jgi:hypothetical protein
VAAAAAIGSSAFWCLTAAFVLSSFAISAVAVHLIPYLLEGGRSAGFAALAAGLMGLMQVPGRVVFAASDERREALRQSTLAQAIPPAWQRCCGGRCGSFASQENQFRPGS